MFPTVSMEGTPANFMVNTASNAHEGVTRRLDALPRTRFHSQVRGKYGALTNG